MMSLRGGDTRVNLDSSTKSPPKQSPPSLHLFMSYYLKALLGFVPSERFWAQAAKHCEVRSNPRPYGGKNRFCRGVWHTPFLFPKFSAMVLYIHFVFT